jgi:hypothetical protein
MKKITDSIVVFYSRPLNRKPHIFHLKEIIHEGYHIGYGGGVPIFGKYWLSETDIYETGFKESFPVPRIDSIIPKEIKRSDLKGYNLYVVIDSATRNAIRNIPNVGQYFGFRSLGMINLLDELTAYYHNMKIYNRTYDYLKKKNMFNKDSIALHFLIESEVVASTSFMEYYVLKYIEYAKINYPDLYKEYTSNKNFITMFNVIHKENEKTISNYYNYKAEILKLKPKLKNKYNSQMIDDPFNKGFKWILPDESIIFGHKLLKGELNKYNWIVP